MKPRFDKRTVRDLALAVGLSSVLIALLLICVAELAPPIAAAPTPAEVGPVWTTIDPITRTIDPLDVWFIEKYGVTITFKDGALRETAVFTFTPRPDLEIEYPSVVSTIYLFELYGTLLSTGGPVSLWKDIRYTLQYEKAGLGEVTEHSLEAYRASDRWLAQDATLDTTANRITWETNFTGRFGIGGFGPRSFLYVPTTFNAGFVRAAQAKAEPIE